MSPLPDPLAPPAGGALWVGIDPGANAGVVALDVSRSSQGNPVLRLVGAKVLHAATRPRRSSAENRAALYVRAVAQFREWIARHPSRAVAGFVLERPADARPMWGKRQGGKGSEAVTAAVGTLFGVGEAYGLLLAACETVAVSGQEDSARIFAHPVTSGKAKPRRAARVGWFNPDGGKIPKREQVLSDMRRELRQLAGLGDIFPENAHPEDIAMAYGVLRFHLLRFPDPLNP